MNELNLAKLVYIFIALIAIYLIIIKPALPEIIKAVKSANLRTRIPQASRTKKDYSEAGKCKRAFSTFLRASLGRRMQQSNSAILRMAAAAIVVMFVYMPTEEKRGSITLDFSYSFIWHLGADRHSVVMPNWPILLVQILGVVAIAGLLVAANAMRKTP